MKKIILFIIGLLTLLLSTQLTTFAAKETIGDYDFDKDTGTIHKYYGAETEVVIPSEIDGVKVVGIGNNAFRVFINFPPQVQTVKSIIIPEGVTHIGKYAFAGDSKVDEYERETIHRNLLENVQIPRSVTSIGTGAFEYSNINSITLPEGVVRIEDHTFSHSDLTDISLSPKTQYIGEGAFQNTKITEIIIPGGVENIYLQTFAGCSNLKKVVLGEGVKHIEGGYGYISYEIFVTKQERIKYYGAFDYCTRLESITFPESLQTIGDFSFRGCRSLKSIVLPEQIQDLGVGIFSECTALTDVSLPNTLTILPPGIFANCTNLEKIELPNELTIIGGRHLYLGIVNHILLYDYMGAFSGCTSLTSIELPESVASIDEFAFYNCINLKSITIPNRITDIKEWGFYKCDNLTVYTLHGSYAAQYAIARSIPVAYLPEYELSDLTMYDTDNNLLSSIPTADDFALAFDVEKKSSVTDAKLIIAFYDENGACLDVYVDESFLTDLQTNKTSTFTKQITQIQDKKIGKIKVFIWDGLNNVMPASDVKSIW